MNLTPASTIGIITIITVLTLITAWSVIVAHRARQRQRAAESIARHARRDAETSAAHAARARLEADRITKLNSPAPVSREELATKYSGAAKKLINPARPQAQRSRPDAGYAPTVYTDTTPSASSCDTSSSTDSGSCGGGE